ncbi:TPA: HAD domain-containing protein [Salmonella enterica subsp. diarizonae serovar 61:l,v:z35]
MIQSIYEFLCKFRCSPQRLKNNDVDGILSQEESTAGLWGPLPSIHVVLFLDFDGVIHKCQNESFEWMYLIERLLDASPSMFIVISSSWRECGSISYLKSLFRSPYRDRVIGATPSLYLPSGSIGVRAAECEEFVARYRVKAFICLDDDTTLFPTGYPHLFRTDYYTGVKEKDITDLIARYNLLMTRFS